MNTKRLLKLADFLDRLPREKFDFGQIVNQSGKPMLEALKRGATRCGTVACAIGWMPAVFPRGLEWTHKNYYSVSQLDIALRNDSDIINFDAVVAWFGISFPQAKVIFAPNHSGFGLSSINARAKPKTVARRIRRFVEKNARRRV